MKVVKPALLALACALILSVTDRQTRQAIADNQVHFEQAALRAMVPGLEIVSTSDGYRLQKSGTDVGWIRSITTERGYNGRIRLQVAASLDNEILGIRVLEHQETPGLGDVIDHPDWQRQFSGHSPDSDWRLKPDGDFDGITGATITARATINAISEVLGDE